MTDPGRGAQGTRLPLADQYFLNFRGFEEGVGLACLFRGWRPFLQRIPNSATGTVLSCQLSTSHFKELASAMNYGNNT